jgi:F-type H+-transporting ATPase subunit c
MEDGVFGIAHAIAVLGAGFGLLGGCVGIGLIGGKALEAIARQPEERKAIRTNMLLMAALIEGLAFFGAIIALIVIFKGAPKKEPVTESVKPAVQAVENAAAVTSPEQK